MRILVLSDLHNEFGSVFQPDPGVLEQCDVVVLAGDIDKGVLGLSWARQAFADKPVVYVCGNHEFYGHDWTQLLDELRQSARSLSIHFLEDDAVRIDGVQFLGCALWTDFRFFPYQSVTSVMRACERGMNDFRRIAAAPLQPPPGISRESQPAAVRYGRKLTAQHVRLRHRASVSWLREQLQRANAEGSRPVVVTHHLPSERSVAPRFARDELTPAFASHLDDLLAHAQLWIHGHTHDSTDYVIQTGQTTTRVVCNPRGYPLSAAGVLVFENPGFKPGLIVEI